jgi:ring-1,2-phenylacetyl-CoA epoxidase subunit PaaD
MANAMEDNGKVIDEAAVWQLLDTVCDPEIPVLSITDLGIVKQVSVTSSKITVTITPTYTGCPAMDMIATNIRLAFAARGFTQLELKTVLSPAWTTDWITEEGKARLKQYGIAPPNKKMEIPEDGIECPLCGLADTKLLSAFGSTACKALYQCQQCKEPFDYFKCH